MSSIMFFVFVCFFGSRLAEHLPRALKQVLSAVSIFSVQFSVFLQRLNLCCVQDFEQGVQFDQDVYVSSTRFITFSAVNTDSSDDAREKSPSVGLTWKYKDRNCKNKQCHHYHRIIYSFVQQNIRSAIY